MASRVNSRPSRVGVALSVGAGIGATIGVLVAGGPDIAIGAAAGAWLGVVVGALWDLRAPHETRGEA